MTNPPLSPFGEPVPLSHDTPAWAEVPVFIVNRNRLGALQRLVDWLLAAGTRRIVILDNASDFPPLLRYYEDLPHGAKALLLPVNHGPYVLWEQGVHRSLDTPYVVTDSDVVPTDECPADLIGALLDQLRRHPQAKKVGCGLRIDNLPDSYGEAETVRRWESQFWERPIQPGVFAAPVDTTFAVYPARGEFSNEPCNLRLGRPYLVEHTPWYADEQALDAEETYYRNHTSPIFSNWSVAGKDSWVRRSDRVAQWTGRPKVLHMDGGRDHILGWINAGRGERRFDLRADVTNCREDPLQLTDDSLDGIHLSHVLEPVDDPWPLFEQLHRAAKPGARLFIRERHGARDDAWSDPAQRSAWTEASFASLARSTSVPGTSYAADWRLESVHVIADDDRSVDGSRAQPAAATEIVAVLTAIKPARAPRGGPVHVPVPIVTGCTAFDPQFQSVAGRAAS